MHKRHLPTVFRLAIALIFAIFFFGCSDDTARPLEIKVVSGADQCAARADGSFPEPLRVEVRSGRRGVPGVKVECFPEPGARLDFVPASGVTDAGGAWSTRISAGATGDQYFTVRVAGRPETKRRLRVVNGVEVSGDGAEGGAGKTLREPLSVRLIRGGRGVAGVPVRFGVRSGESSGVRVAPPECVTNERGVAATRVTLGKVTGHYDIDVDVDGGAQGFAVRSRGIRVVAVNWPQVAMAVLGGVALFIFGMGLMSDGLRAAAGDKLKNLLKLFTRNRVTALFAGALVTAGLQSSAAVTVMVTGFINAGLLTLRQSLGIIFGANIGTTVTAQIISFDIAGAALPAVALGLALTFAGKRGMQGFGRALIGFGLLLLGMKLMCTEVGALGEVPSFRKLFTLFDCAPRGGPVPPGAMLGALLIGFVCTAILHSSAAFTGIALALAAGGMIDFYTAFVLLLGSNVGTTVTTLIAAARLNRVAKQAALAHFIFNSFGALVMVLLLYVPWGRNGDSVFLVLVDALTPGDAFAPVPQNLERHIAMAHTLFNVSVAFLLLPFTGSFEWLCNKLLPIRDASARRIRLLEPRLLNTPHVALRQCASAIRDMVRESWVMIDRSLNEHFLGREFDSERIDAISRMEDEVDNMQREITDYLVLLMRKPLPHELSTLVPLLMHATNDAERIADHAENIIALAKRMERGGDKLSERAVKSLKKLWRILDDEAQQVITALDDPRHKPVKVALKDERRINKLADKLETEHIERLRKGECSAPAGVTYIEMLGELEKIGDRLTNIAERTPHIQSGIARL